MNRIKRLNPDSTEEKGNRFRHLGHGKYNNVHQTFVIMIQNSIRKSLKVLQSLRTRFEATTVGKILG